MKKLLVLLALVAVTLLGCSAVPQQNNDVELCGSLKYVVDEAHEVAIFMWDCYSSGGMTVIPLDEIDNPYQPMRLKAIVELGY